ncbi:MAG: multifunctional CCA addition/repair protein [Proteobacteria bacterium]|nr:multifunctional CCA addition/repair protein [Pseudomonadota bacterium]
MKIYLVGGAVRDRLLGLPVKERDWVVVGATPEQMLKQGFKPVGKDFPVFLHPETAEEYALARTERKSGKGYTGFECYAAADVTLEQDLLRRDLTINAMAEDENGCIIDPYQGQKDLQDRVLRHVSPAFTEDPLRVLRLARFAARYAPLSFTVAEETLQLLLAIVRNGELEHLVPERVWLELDKVLGEADPEVFLQVLRRCGALAVLFPSIDRLYGVPASAKWHPEIDSGIHLELALKTVSTLTTDKVVRFSVLLHDLGKGVTPITEWPSHKGHDVEGLPLIEEFCDRYPVPKEYKRLALLASRYHILAHQCEELTPKKILELFKKLDAFRRPQTLQQFLLACEADAHGRAGLQDRTYPQKEYLEGAYQAAAKVSVQEIMDAGKEGPAISEELHRRRISQIKNYSKKAFKI